MHFKSIIKNINENYEIDLLNNKESIRVIDIQLLDSHTTYFEKNILFIGDGNSIDPNISLPEQFISTTCLPSYRKVPNNFAIIKYEDLPTVFNYIQHIFNNTLKVTNHFSQLLSMSTRGDDTQKIVDLAAKKLNNPLIIIDTGFKILFHSNNYDISDDIWKANIDRGYCTYEFITSVNKIMNYNAKPMNSSAYLFECPSSIKRKLCSKILWNNSLIGYTIMLEENTPIDILQEELLPYISIVTADSLSKSHSFLGIHGSLKSMLLFQILDNYNNESILIQMQTTNIKISSQLYCIVIPFNNLEKVNQWQKYTEEKVSQIFPDSFITTYNGYIVSIVPLGESSEINNQNKIKLVELLSNTKQKAYKSQIFTNILQCKKYFNQCLFLHDLSHKVYINQLIINYNDFAFYDLLTQFKDASMLESFIDPSLKRLKKYDLENNSSLFKTLETYINCQYSITKTSAALFIHRNSFTYRIKKIEELTKINFDDASQLFNISFSYYISNFIS